MDTGHFLGPSVRVAAFWQDCPAKCRADICGSCLNNGGEFSRERQGGRNDQFGAMEQQI
jgi:hypothetical protein